MTGVVKTDEFVVVADDGEALLIIEYTDMIPTGELGDPFRTIPGQKTLLTSRGQHVNYRDYGTYEIVESGKIVRKISRWTSYKEKWIRFFTTRTIIEADAANRAADLSKDL